MVSNRDVVDFLDAYVREAVRNRVKLNYRQFYTGKVVDLLLKPYDGRCGACLFTDFVMRTQRERLEDALSSPSPDVGEMEMRRLTARTSELIENVAAQALGVPACYVNEIISGWDAVVVWYREQEPLFDGNTAYRDTLEWYHDAGLYLRNRYMYEVNRRDEDLYRTLTAGT